MTTYQDEGIQVEAPSGAVFVVLTDDEVAYFEKTAESYRETFKITNISDLQDLDRILFMETLCWRWSTWLSREKDYWGGAIDTEGIKRSLNDFSKELRLLKKQMGIDKATRDRERGESISDYIDNLRNRAKEFAIMRNEQCTKVITLFQELSALMTLRRNTDEIEKKDLNVEDGDILEWIEKVALQEFDAIDQAFMSAQQRYWVKEL